MQYSSYSIGPCFCHQSHPQLGIVFALALSLHYFWSYFSTEWRNIFALIGEIASLLIWGVPLSVSYHFAFSYCSWGSQGKNAEVVFNIPFSSGPCFVRSLHKEFCLSLSELSTMSIRKNEFLILKKRERERKKPVWTCSPNF